MQGETYAKAAQALRDGDLDAAGLDQPHRMLLDFVATITKHAYRVTDEQVQVGRASCRERVWIPV